MINIISSHYNEALARLLQQYKDQPNIAKFIGIYATQVQELEQIIHDMFTNRMLNDSVGIQLDRLGEIVGVARQGFADNEYRVLILVKIGQNSSQGTPEDVINIVKLLPLTVPSERVHYQNLGTASIMVYTAAEIPPEDVTFIYDNIQEVVAAGVRIDHFASYSPDDAFAFSGINGAAAALGFSDDDFPLTGGKLAKLNIKKVPFAFSGNNPTYEGLGSIQDPVAGGVLIGL